MSLKVKIIGLTIILVVAMIAGLSIYTNVLVNNLIHDNAETTYSEQAVSIVNAIETKLNDTEIAVNTVAKNTEIEKAFAERDREKLVEMLEASYASIADQVAQFQFHLPTPHHF